MRILESIYNLERMKEVESGMLEHAKGKYEELEALHLEKVSNLTGVVVDGGLKKDDVVEFIYKTREEEYLPGISLHEHIKRLENNIKFYNEQIEEYYKTLNNLSGIEFELYSLIKYKGVLPTKAVQEVSKLYGKEEQTIWKNYYKKIKKYLKK